MFQMLNIHNSLTMFYLYDNPLLNVLLILVVEIIMIKINFNYLIQLQIMDYMDMNLEMLSIQLID